MSQKIVRMPSSLLRHCHEPWLMRGASSSGRLLLRWRIKPRFDRLLVALPPVRDLLLCAKHLFIAAIRQPSRGFKDETHQTYCAPNISEPPPTASVACCAHQVQNFDLSQRFWCRGLWGLGFNEQIFAQRIVGAGTMKGS